MEQRLPVGFGQIEGEPALVAVGTQVVGGQLVAEERRAPGAGVVAGAGAFELQDLGPEVAEELGAERPGEDAGGVEDAEAGERGVHV